MKIVIVKNTDEMAKYAANIIAEKVRNKPDSVLGFATGSTPIGTYNELVKLYKSGEISFEKIISFNLDEYCGLSGDNPKSYRFFMMKNLFRRININPENIHILNGLAVDFAEECENYEREIIKAGGIDLQILGIGHNGHIGFNEPGTFFYNKTRKVSLTENTINANKRFFEKIEDVPKFALSMGIKTIMAAKKIILLAGPEKYRVINKLKSETVSPKLPASILHYHPDCTVIFAEGTH